jgi:hypothetical protein
MNLFMTAPAMRVATGKGSVRCIFMQTLLMLNTERGGCQ